MFYIYNVINNNLKLKDYEEERFNNEDNEQQC